MAEAPAPSRPKPWRLDDIVNLEFFLQREPHSGALPPDKQLRARVAAFETTSPSPAVTRRYAFQLWLDARIRAARSARLPGAAVVSALRSATVILSLFAFLAGISLVLSLLDRSTKSFNVQVFFAAAVLAQLALLALLLLGWFFRRTVAGAGTLSLLQQGIRALVSHLARRLDPDQRVAAEFRDFARTYARLIAWPIFGISQTAATFFNLGLLAGFFGCLLFLDLSFYWESTFGAAMDRTLYRITDFLSIPWTWFRPDWTPSFELIQDRGLDAASRRVPGRDHAWYPFLLCALVVWGLLPRVILRAAAAVGQRRALARVALNQRHHRELWRQLTTIDLHAEASPPADGAVVLNWNGIEIEPAELHNHVIRQLRLNPIEIRVAGDGAPAADDETLLALSERVRNRMDSAELFAAIVVLAESWGLVPKRMQDLFAKIRGHFGREIPIHFFLIGNPAAGTRFTRPPEEDVHVWEEFVQDLNDPFTDVRAFRDGSGDLRLET